MKGDELTYRRRAVGIDRQFALFLGRCEIDDETTMLMLRVGGGGIRGEREREHSIF